MVPLALLLWLQYRWLQDLERTSTIARQSALENYLAVITQEVKYRYLTAAERMRHVPASILRPAFEDRLDEYFQQEGDPAIRRHFVVDFQRSGSESVQFFDSKTERLFLPEWTPELSAVQMAVAPWRVIHKQGDPGTYSTFIGEERNRDHRMILRPLVDEDSYLVGMLGMILDTSYFHSSVLPKAIAGALPEFKDQEQLQVSVRDGEGRWVLGEIAWLDSVSIEDALPPIHLHMLFVFKDWEVFLIGPSAAPQDWARANFAYNVSLTLVLSLLVVGGLALLLRATGREMHLSEMKNDFVSNVSHELRTPLASIRVFGELLRLGKFRDVEKVHEYGDYIETESRRLTQLIDNILDFSRIEAGHKAYNFESIDLVDVVHQILTTWRVRLQHQGFSIDFQDPPAMPPLEADPDAIGQALFNLLDNAVKYSAESRYIEVRLLHSASEAVIEVTDHGVGISRAEQKHIFDRFHRVGSGLAHDVKGSGLGLSLVQHIASAHSGRVTVDSQLGQGSTFALHLPLGTAQDISDLEMQALRAEAVSQP